MGQAHFELLTNFTSLTFSQRGERKPWRKILYERQPYADNYFDEALFLQGLRRNSPFHPLLFLLFFPHPPSVNVVTYEYWDVVQDSSVVTLQMTTVAFFCSLFVHVKSGTLHLPSSLPPLSHSHPFIEAIPVPLLYTLTAFFAVVGFLFWLRLTPDVTSERILTHFKSLVLLLSPPLPNVSSSLFLLPSGSSPPSSKP